MSMPSSPASDPEVDHAVDHEDPQHQVEDGQTQSRQEQGIVSDLCVVTGISQEDHGTHPEGQDAEHQGRDPPFSRQGANLQEHAGTLPDHVSKTGQNAGEIAAGLALDADRHDDVVEVLDLGRSEEHTSELQSLMRISYAVFCLKKKT